ncbi:transposase-like protein [Bradyrhizobium sp. LM2.7]
MTVTKIRTDVSAVKQLLASDKEFLKPLIQAAVQETLEAEMTETLGRKKGSAPKHGWAIAPATTHAR